MKNKKPKDNPALQALAARLLHREQPADKDMDAAALVPEPSDSVAFAPLVGQIVQVPIDKLTAEHNVRSLVHEDEGFTALIESVRQRGVLQNLVVRVKVLPNGREELAIVSGQRRWLASRRAGLNAVPCLLIRAEDEQAKLVYGLIENLLREDLSPVDLGQAYTQLLSMGATVEEIAQSVGKHKKTIQRYANLMQWPAEALALILAHPAVFSTEFLFNGMSQDVLADPDLLVLRLRKKIEQTHTTQAASPTPQFKAPDDPRLPVWSKQLRQHLGVPVAVRGSLHNMRITIRCKNPAEVNDLFRRLGIEPAEEIHLAIE